MHVKGYSNLAFDTNRCHYKTTKNTLRYCQAKVKFLEAVFNLHSCVKIPLHVHVHPYV